MKGKRLIKSFRFILNTFLLTSLISCSSAPPSQVYVKKSQLSKIQVVALNVSSSKFDVKYSRETEISPGNIALMGLAPIFGLIPLTIGSIGESLTESSEDHNLANGLQKTIAEKYFEKLLADYFLEQFKEVNLFKINYLHNKNTESVINEGYDAIIELNIEELSLKRVWNRDRLNVYTRISGKMANLNELTAIKAGVTPETGKTSAGGEAG